MKTEYVCPECGAVGYKLTDGPYYEIGCDDCGFVEVGKKPS